MSREQSFIFYNSVLNIRDQALWRLQDSCYSPPIVVVCLQLKIISFNNYRKDEVEDIFEALCKYSTGFYSY